MYMNFDDFDLEVQCEEYYSEKIYIIENITQKEQKILENNGINFYPDATFEMEYDAIISGKDEYNKAMRLLRR